MATLNNSAEGGTNTTVVTTANSGGVSGDAFGTIVGSPTFSSVAAMHGTLSYAMLNPASVAHYTRWDWTANAPVSWRFYYRRTALPTAAFELFRINNASSNNVAAITDNTGGKLTFAITGPGSLVTTTTTGNPTLANSTWYRVEGYADATTLNWGFFVYSGDSTTALGGLSGTAGVAFTNGSPAQMRIGHTTTGAMAGNMFLDDIHINNGVAALPGPVGAAPAYRSSQFMVFF